MTFVCLIFYFNTFLFLWRTALKTTYLRDGCFLLKGCLLLLLLEIMMQNHFVSRKKLLITHHTTKRSVYSKLNYDWLQLHSKYKGSLNGQNGRYQILQISCFLLFLVSVVRPLPHSGRARRNVIRKKFFSCLHLDLIARSPNLSPNFSQHAFHLHLSVIKWLW